jgi:hypothetical protein
MRNGLVLQDIVNHVLQDICCAHNPINFEKEDENQVNSYNKEYYKHLMRPVDQIIKENFVFKKGD